MASKSIRPIPTVVSRRYKSSIFIKENVILILFFVQWVSFYPTLSLLYSPLIRSATVEPLPPLRCIGASPMPSFKVYVIYVYVTCYIYKGYSI